MHYADDRSTNLVVEISYYKDQREELYYPTLSITRMLKNLERTKIALLFSNCNPPTYLTYSIKFSYMMNNHNVQTVARGNWA